MRLPYVSVPAVILSVALSAVPSMRADTQEVVYTNRIPVYVGDLVNEADASLDEQHAQALCERLNSAIPIPGTDNAQAHDENCIFHIVRFNDLTDPTQVQTPDVQHWYTFSTDPRSGFWSLEDLQQNKRLFGAAHVSFFLS